jgi:hypothetical protein
MRASVRLSVALCAIAAIAACKKSEPTAGSDPWGPGSAATGSAAPGSAAPVAPTPAMGGATPVVPAITAPLAKPFFFTATKGGHTVYLFGTIHLGAQPSAIPTWVLDRLDHAPTFAMEANATDPAMLTAAFRQDGSTLEQELGPETWAKLTAVVGARLADSLRGMKVSAAATILEMKDIAMTTPLDLFLVNRAKDAQKEIVYLEEGAKQLALLDKWMDARALRMMLDDPLAGPKATGKLLAAYAAGDADAAVALGQDDSDWLKAGRTRAEFDQFNKEMLFDRNASWIAPIDAMVARGDAFVAVGALHLLGPGSVPDLLGKAGYKVARVAAP